MPIAHITDIKYKSSFDSQYGGPDGKLHSHTVAFSDGIVGTANTKTPTPYYKIGDEMAYTITEQNKYGYKLKIEKLAPGMGKPTSAPQPDPAANPGPAAGFAPNVQAMTPVNGPTAGMAVKTALDLLTKGLEQSDVVERICAPVFWSSVHEVASDICRVMQRLEEGNLARSVKERATGVVAGRPKAGPGGAVALDSNPDLETVPY